MSSPASEVAALVTRYLPALRAFVRLRMGRELRAKEAICDIVQSVTREILQHADRFQHGGDSGFRQWLFTTAHRKVVNRLTRLRTHKRGGGKQEAELPEELAAVEAAFDALTDEQREVVTASRILGMSHAEIAQRLGSTPGLRADAGRPGRLAGILPKTFALRRDCGFVAIVGFQGLDGGLPQPSFQRAAAWDDERVGTKLAIHLDVVPDLSLTPAAAEIVRQRPQQERVALDQDLPPLTRRMKSNDLMTGDVVNEGRPRDRPVAKIRQGEAPDPFEQQTRNRVCGAT